MNEEEEYDGRREGVPGIGLCNWVQSPGRPIAIEKCKVGGGESEDVERVLSCSAT